MVEIKQVQGGYDKNFFYMIHDENEACVIDCFDPGWVNSYLQSRNLKLKYIISTHNHYDHVDGNEELLKNTDAKLVMHKTCKCDIGVDEGDILNIGESKLKILHTPGHTMDSICLLLNDIYLFTGDTLFVGGIGRIFCENGEEKQKETIKRLMNLPGNIQVMPGHNYGAMPHSYIKIEKMMNPRVKDILN